MSGGSLPPTDPPTHPGGPAPELAQLLVIAEEAVQARELRRLIETTEALRATIAPVVAADARWAQARALLLEAIADGWRAQVGPIRVGSLALLLALGSGCLGVLSLAGVAVDLGGLADAAAHAWSGQPHRIECDPPHAGPLSPAPSSEDTPR